MPVPYTRDDAAQHLRHHIPDGWESDRAWGFVVEARDQDGQQRFAGTVSLRNRGEHRAEISYGAHPWARGQGIMERALRLLLSWGFEQRDLKTVLWLSHRGNWASRSLARRLGFSLDGTVRSWLPHREDLVDTWAGTLTRGEEMSARVPWLESPTLRGSAVAVRRIIPADLARIVESLNDPETQRWSQTARDGSPHTVANHASFIDERLEEAATGRHVHWAVADLDSDQYLGWVSLLNVHHGREAELSYCAHPHARRRGWTTEACRLVVRHCFVDLADGGLGLHRLTASAAAENEGSHRVLERAGFMRVGRERESALMRDGSWADSITFDQLAQDRERYDW